MRGDRRKILKLLSPLTRPPSLRYGAATSPHWGEVTTGGRNARFLARTSHTVMGVTEANLSTGKEKHVERSGATVKCFDTACRQMRPALRVAHRRAERAGRLIIAPLCGAGGPSGSSKSSTVGKATPFGLLLPDRLRPRAMTPREGVRNPG